MPVTNTGVAFVGVAGPAGPAGASAGTYLSTQLVRFVDYVNGSDGNNGLDPAHAYKTIAAAYSNLQTVALANHTANNGTLGVGQIICMPGAHDVGTGVVIDYRYPVRITGFASGVAYYLSDSDTVIYSSSAAVTEFFLTGDSATHVTYGNIFEDLTFRINESVNTTMVNNANFGACIRAQSNDYLRVRGCSTFTVGQTNVDVPLLIQQSGSAASDHAWLRLHDNICRSTPLYWARAAGQGTNFNSLWISHNVVQFGSGASYPMIWLEGEVWASLIEINNLEGGASGPHCRVGSASHGANSNVFLMNRGEASTHTYPFYDVINGGHNIFDGGYCTCDGGQIGDWIIYSTNAYNNVCRGWVVDPVNGSTGFKRRITDNSTYPAQNWCYGRGGAPLLHVKTNTVNPTFSGSDFNPTPVDGTVLGLGTNTNTGENRIWVAANGGGYHYVTLTG